MRRLLAALLVSLVGVVGVPAPAGAAMRESTYENRTVWRINQQRGPNLVRSDCLDRYARQVALNMVFPLRHAELGSMLVDCDAYAAGEVLAWLSTYPYGTVQAWMHSPEHRQVILRHRYHRIGVAAIPYGEMWLVVVRVTDRSK